MAKPAPRKPQAETPPTAESESEPASGEQLEAIETAAIQGTPDFTADEAELGQESSGYRWHISRAVYPTGLGGKRMWETCTSYPAGEGVLTADTIREDWGPGTFYAQLRPAAGTGAAHGGVKKTRVFTLAAPRSSGTPAPANADLTAGLQKILEAQQRGFEQLLGALNRPAPAPATTPEQMMDLALRMADRMTPKRNEESTLETVGRWFELADRFRAGKDWTDLASQGIETARPLVDAVVSRLGGTPAPRADNGAAQPTTVNGSSAPTAAHASPPQPIVTGPPMLQLANYLQRQARYLTGKAKAKANPSLYAEVLLDNLPPDVTFELLLKFAKEPGVLDRLFTMLPNDDRIAAQAERVWFEELLREIVNFLEKPAGVAPVDEEHEVGDTSEG